VLIAVLLALAGACAFAVDTVVQHRVATDTAATGGGRWLVRLARRPAWLAAQATGGLGVLLHAAALRSGPVTLVQPLLAGGLVFALALGSWVDRRHPERARPGRGQWLAALAVAVGLATFLLAARPAAGTSTAPAVALAVLAAVALVVAGLATLWTRFPARSHRAIVRGAAAGTCFGVTGLLLKQLLGAPVPSWTAAATAVELVAVAVAGIALSQAAFAAGPLVESLPVTTVLEPAIGVVLAGPLFGEALLSGTGARLGQLAGALLLVAGLVVLAGCGSNSAGEPVRDAFRSLSGEPARVDA
jgi:drug/metabolite transporter (DMT)-like permease